MADWDFTEKCNYFITYTLLECIFLWKFNFFVLCYRFCSSDWIKKSFGTFKYFFFKFFPCFNNLKDSFKMNIFDARVEINILFNFICSIFFHIFSFIIFHCFLFQKICLMKCHKNVINSFFDIDSFLISLKFWSTVDDILKNTLYWHFFLFFHEIESLVCKLF